MNPKHAQYMLTVYQEGSITKAAKKLYISQPSLSQMIKLIEKDLGTPIFNRQTDPLSLTCAGERYIKAAMQILAIQSNLQKEIEEIVREEQGKIKLGIPVQRGMQVLPKALPLFFQRYPHVELELTEAGSTETETLVINGEVDLACLSAVPRHRELTYILLEKEEPVLLAGRHTDLAARIPAGTPISVTEAKDEIFISNKPGHNIRAIQDSLFISNNIHPKILLETISIEIEKKVTLACGGVMLCPKSYLENDPEIARCGVTYPLTGISNMRHCYICHRRDRYLPKYMREFIEILLS